jgi:lactate dehydrogenase-like 2-hydroxyacid dehydrogenase
MGTGDVNHCSFGAALSLARNISTGSQPVRRHKVSGHKETCSLSNTDLPQ